MIHGKKQLYVSQIPRLLLSLLCGWTSVHIISSPGPIHHLIIISRQWDTLIALLAPLDWRCE